MSRRDTRRIAFINEKGGSGKTTLVANLAAHLASRQGQRVLCIDMDPQGQLGKVLGVEVRRTRRSAIELLVDGALGADTPRDATPSGDLPVQPTRIPGLDLIVGNKSLALFPVWSETEGPGAAQDALDPTERLARRLAEAEQSGALREYDYLLIDAPPSFGPLTLNILRACDEAVVPVPLTFLALDGCAELMRTIELVRTRYGHPDLRLTMVVPTFHRRTKLAAEILEKLAKRFPTELARTVVGYSVKIDEAQSRGRSIFDYAPRDRGARCMAELACELAERAPAAHLAASPTHTPNTNPPPAGDRAADARTRRTIERSSRRSVLLDPEEARR